MPVNSRPFPRIGAGLVLFAPAVLIGLSVLSSPSPAAVWVLGGVAATFALAFAIWLVPTTTTRAAKSLPVGLYLLALMWFYLAMPDRGRQVIGLAAPAGLLAGAALLLGDWALSQSEARLIRQARRVAARIATRKSWPNDLASCAEIPEVAEFRKVLAIDATPALELLAHPRLEVRAAALGALRFRPNYRPGQSGLVLQQAQTARDPYIRVAAILALAKSESRHVIETLGAFMTDPEPAVRRAAAEYLCWENEQRWTWVRFHVQSALATAGFAGDGPLAGIGSTLPPQALLDLLAWSSETGTLAVRSVETLKRYFLNALQARPSNELTAELRRLLFEPKSASLLRVEIGHMLHSRGLLPGDQMTGLLSMDTPAPLKLMAADAILSERQDDNAVQALRELARMPNRELAVAVAQIVQRRLNVPMGLHLDAPPAPSTRQAGEVTRRVQDWATGRSSWGDDGPRTPQQPRLRE